MKNVRCLTLLLFLSIIPLFVIGQNQQLERPKLVVGIVVDQMRWDYLYRYYDLYGDDGFKRMLNDGFSFDNCMINYVPSYTAVGHSTVYTGSVPAIHGITGNDFIDRSSQKSIYCTQDDAVRTVGLGDLDVKAGKMSPFNLQATTVTDQLKYATNFRSKVVGVSLKDRGSILPAGHAADAAFWFDFDSGKWITSTWYMESLPQWLQDYNVKNMPEKYLKKNWKPLLSLDKYVQSAKNGNGRYEAGLKGVDIPSLPLNTSKLIKTEGVGAIAYTPYGDVMTVDVAKLAIENMGLGKHDDTDFLAVSFSAPDKIAHQFSINSVLTQDLYLRLDKVLGEFFSYLDQKVGKGNYLVFLTADHAGTPNAKFMSDNRLPGSLWMAKEETKKLNTYLKSIYGFDNLAKIMNYQVVFDHKQIESANIDMAKLKKTCIDYLKKMEDVVYAVDIDQVMQSVVPSMIKEKIVNGYFRNRSGDIQIVLKPGGYDWGGKDPSKGGSHGSWTPDDAHIPFLLMGWGIKPGKSVKEVYMTDIAPTIASLLHIQMPNGCVGKTVYGD